MIVVGDRLHKINNKKGCFGSSFHFAFHKSIEYMKI